MKAADFKRIYEDGLDLWPQLAGKSVFVAWGDGLIDRSITSFLDHLRTEGVSVRFDAGFGREGWSAQDPKTFSDFQLSADYLINCATVSNDSLMESAVVGAVNLCNFKKAEAVMMYVGGTGKVHDIVAHHLRSMARNLQIARMPVAFELDMIVDLFGLMLSGRPCMPVEIGS